MYKIYDDWPTIARESYEKNHNTIDFKDINHIVFSGMGGSGTLGDIFSSTLSKTNVYVTVNKGYLLPRTVDKNTFVVVTSISGNTVEALTVLKSAMGLKCKLIALSSGGKIESFCSEHNIQYFNIPLIHSARSSLIKYVYSMLKILKPILPIKEVDIGQSISELEKLSNNISSQNLTKSNVALALAEWITGISLVYYPSGLRAVAIRFKNSLQENAKSHIMIEDVIESCHNGIVSWEKPSNVQPILIEGVDDNINTKERWNILKEYFNEKNIDYKEILSIDGGIFSKIINLIYLLDYTTIYHAILLGIDPSPVKSVDFVKSRLRNF